MVWRFRAESLGLKAEVWRFGAWSLGFKSKHLQVYRAWGLGLRWGGLRVEDWGCGACAET